MLPFPWNRISGKQSHLRWEPGPSIFSGLLPSSPHPHTIPTVFSSPCLFPEGSDPLWRVKVLSCLILKELFFLCREGHEPQSCKERSALRASTHRQVHVDGQTSVHLSASVSRSCTTLCWKAVQRRGGCDLF